MKNLVILLFACILVLLSACGTNSEVNGKEYLVTCPPNVLINTIKSLKEKHPEYDLMRYRDGSDSLTNQDDYLPNHDRPTWMYIHFCLPIKDSIVIIKTDIYLGDGAPTSFYLLGRTYDKDFRGYEQLRNLPDKERQEIQTLFETLVLSEIEKKHAIIGSKSKFGKQLMEFGEWLNYKLTNIL